MLWYRRKHNKQTEAKKALSDWVQDIEHTPSLAKVPACMQGMVRKTWNRCNKAQRQSGLHLLQAHRIQQGPAGATLLGALGIDEGQGHLQQHSGNSTLLERMHTPPNIDPASQAVCFMAACRHMPVVQMPPTMSEGAVKVVSLLTHCFWCLA